MPNDVHSLSHTKWNCKYHIVFAPKYRRSILWREKERDRSDIKETVRMERNQHNRGGGMSGSYTYASGDTTEI